MYNVMIQCFSTGRLVSTGLRVDPEKAAALPAQPTRMSRCTACGHPHDWSRWSAILTAAERAA